MKWIAIALVLTGCATAKAPPPPHLPQWSAIPASVLDSFCASLHDEGISNTTTLNIVKTTQTSLITPLAMQALADSFFYHGPLAPTHTSAAALATASEVPIGIPGGCAWPGIAPHSAEKYADTLTLEVSPPIVNPYARNAAGIFARMALGTESPTWYWLPLVARGESWMAGRITVLPYRQ